MSLLVPVFTAVQNGVASAFSSPNVALRLSRSARMSATTNVAAGESTGSATIGDAAESRSAPPRPPLASVRYAPTSSHRLTSAAPSASAGP